MGKELDVRKGTSQFTNVDGRITERPHRHSLRERLMGLSEPSKDPRGRIKKLSHAPNRTHENVKPQISDNIHIKEGLELHLDPPSERED